MSDSKDGRKTVLITGCTPGGIGHALAREFHSRADLRVFATARRPEVLSDLASLGITTLALDVTSPEAIRNVKETVSSKTGGSLDILVNNAGRPHMVPALDVDMADAKLTFETNFFSVMRMCQEFSAMLIKAKGTILNVGSIAGVIAYPYSATYNASKAALHAYSEMLRIELEPFSVDVIVAITGGVSSNIQAAVTIELPKDSLYKSIIPYIKKFRAAHNDRASTPEAFAVTAVSKVLKQNPPRRFWTGGWSSSLWFAQTFFPDKLLVRGPSLYLSSIN
ncbi:hypothetical protein B7463_g8014, partial [Scytalidium lignicola]